MKGSLICIFIDIFKERIFVILSVFYWKKKLMNALIFLNILINYFAFEILGVLCSNRMNSLKEIIKR